MRVFIALLLTLILTATANAQWTNLCPGQTSNGTVVDFITWNDQLYATGFFTKICGKDAKRIARWSGTAWEPLGTGLTDEGHALEVIDNELFVAKYELAADSNWLFKWNGTAFQKVGQSLWRTNPNPNNSQTPSVYDVLKYQNQIVICGEFDRAGGKKISGIARLSGSVWDSLGMGLSGSIPNTPPVMYPHQLLAFGNDLIVAGNFQKAGDQVVNGIARWDGSKWLPMGAGFNSTVYGIGIFKGELYAGGDFTKSGTTVLNRLAKWNGTAWVDAGLSFPNGSSPNDYIFVHTIREVSGKLYLAGGLKKVQVGATVQNCGAIVAFDGTSVDVLGGGIAGKDIEAIAPYSGGIVVGGGVFGSGYLATYGTTSAAPDFFTENADFDVLPNPANDLIFIRLKNLPQAKYQLVDMAGAVLKSGFLAEPETQVLTSDLPAGPYFLHLHAPTAAGVRKVVLVK